MNLLRLRTWLFLASPMMTMLTLMTLSQVSAIDIDLMEIIDSLQAGTRTALLIAPLRTHLLVIVSSPGSSHLDGGTLVFDQSLDSLGNRSLQLADSAQLFKNKWPTLPSTAGLLFILKNDYELLCTYTNSMDSGSLICFNLEKDAPLVKIPIFSDGINFNSAIPLYSPAKHFLDLLYQMNPYQGAPGVARYELRSDGRVGLSTSMSICSTAVQIQFQGNCQGAYTTAWSLTGGFSSPSLGTFLFERTSLSVIHLATSLDDLFNHLAAVTFTSIPFKSFWSKPATASSVKLSNQTTPAAGSISPDEAASSSSLTQPLTRVTQRTTTASNSHTLVFILIGVFFVFLLIGALAIYLLFKGTGPKEDTKPATVKGDGAGGKTSAKSSKQSGGGLVQAKASKLSGKRGASARSQVKCRRRSSVKLQAASSKCRASPGKMGPAQRVSPLKVAQSSVNNRRASPGKVGPSQGASPLKGQQSKVKSRASPGKVATSLGLGSTR